MVYEPQNNPFASFFFANGPGVNLKLREKIALAQMMQKQKYPKNLGEGLSAIGESLGELGIAKRLEEQDRISQQAAGRLGVEPTPEAAAAAIVPGPQAAAPPSPSPYFQPDQDPTSQAPVPPTVQEGGPPQAPGPMFRPRQPVRTAASMGPVPVASQQGPDPGPNGPIRTNPDGTIAGNLTAPTQLPPPALPPQAAPPPGAPAALAQPQGPPPGPTVANYGQRSILGPTPPPGAEPLPGAPPVMAQGGEEDPRRAIGLSLLRQQMGGQGAPPAAPPTRSAAPPPDPSQGIQPAPTPPQIQPMPGPDGVAKPVYVPPDPGTPQGAPIIPPSAQEMRLQTILNANQGNPYAASSPAAIELGQLQKAREQKQTEANELFKSRITQANEQAKLRQQALIDEEKRRLDNVRGRIEVGDLPTKLAEEGQRRRQELEKGQQDIIKKMPEGGDAAPDPRLGTPQSPQRSGVPVADPAPPGVIPGEWAKDQQKKISEAASNLDAAKPDLGEALTLIKQVREHPAKEWSIGSLGGLARMTPSGQGFVSLTEQLKGKNLVAAYQKIKGTGPVGEREGENIAKAQAALSTATTMDDYDKALASLEGSLRGAVERAERKMNRPVTAYQNTPNDPLAPDIGQIDATWSDGKVRQYIGGDPHDKNKSWKIVR